MICLTGFVWHAGAQVKTVNVKNTAELVQNLASDRVLVLSAGETFDVSTEEMYEGAVSYEEVYDGRELVVSGVRNLTLKSADAQKRAELITQPDYGHVIVFRDCQNITLDMLEAGHGASKGGCVGGVFKFENCQNITITNCDLYGSGIEGLNASNVENLTCRNTAIRGCTYGIMTMVSSNNLRFENCRFHDNQEFDLITLDNCPSVVFENCVVDGNRTGLEDYSAYALYQLLNNTSVSLKNCLIKYNAANYLSTSQKNLKMKNTALRGNLWAKGEYK
ncbi:MAG: hypothetical protein OHK0053_05720 [Microscillaceae bacterium]